MNQIYKKGEFIITPFWRTSKRKEFMVVNTEKEFKHGHTHLKSFEMAQYLIRLARAKKINNGLSPYLLTSLKRISEDEEYIKKLDDLIREKRRKGKKQAYYNCTK
jgi:predicted DNA-binding WGR domain protein